MRTSGARSLAGRYTPPPIPIEPGDVDPLNLTPQYDGPPEPRPAPGIATLGPGVHYISATDIGQELSLTLTEVLSMVGILNARLRTMLPTAKHPWIVPIQVRGATHYNHHAVLTGFTIATNPNCPIDRLPEIAVLYGPTVRARLAQDIADMAVVLWPKHTKDRYTRMIHETKSTIRMSNMEPPRKARWLQPEPAPSNPNNVVDRPVPSPTEFLKSHGLGPIQPLPPQDLQTMMGRPRPLGPSSNRPNPIKGSRTLFSRQYTGNISPSKQPRTQTKSPP